MSLTSTTNVNNLLPTSVPVLEQSGANWVIFQLRFKIAVQGKGLWGHFDGTKIRPVLNLPKSPPPGSSGTAGVHRASTGSSSVAPTVLLGMATENAEWDHNEGISRALLAQRLPNSMLKVINRHPTVAAMWVAVVKEYTYKCAFSQTRLRAEFLSSRSPREGDIRVFLRELRGRRAELDAMGVFINDDDYKSKILQSLLWSLAGFASTQLTAARLQGNSIDPDLLIIVICDEWDRTQFSKRKNQKKQWR